MTTGAACEIRNCGVLAVGRCVDCGRAFCDSHRGLNDWHQWMTNQCTDCAERVKEAKRLANEQAREEERRRKQEAADRAAARDARIARLSSSLLEAFPALATPHWYGAIADVRGFFGSSSRRVAFTRGLLWPIGWLDFSGIGGEDPATIACLAGVDEQGVAFRLEKPNKSTYKVLKYEPDNMRSVRDLGHWSFSISGTVLTRREVVLERLEKDAKARGLALPEG